MNESIYYNVDSIHEAIVKGTKISFRYFNYNINKEQVFRRDGARYIVDPIALSWNNEHYYLISHSNDHEGLTHYRVDKMSDVQMLDVKRDAGSDGFSLPDYSKMVFNMYSAEDADVKLRIHNQLAGAVIDRFGKDISIIADGNQHFIVRVRVAISPVFYGWLFQFGALCEVISPQTLKDKLIVHIKEFLSRLE